MICFFHSIRFLYEILLSIISFFFQIENFSNFDSNFDFKFRISPSSSPHRRLVGTSRIRICIFPVETQNFASSPYFDFGFGGFGFEGMRVRRDARFCVSTGRDSGSEGFGFPDSDFRICIFPVETQNFASSPYFDFGFGGFGETQNFASLRGGIRVRRMRVRRDAPAGRLYGEKIKIRRKMQNAGKNTKCGKIRNAKKIAARKKTNVFFFSSLFFSSSLPSSLFFSSLFFSLLSSSLHCVFIFALPSRTCRQKRFPTNRTTTANPTRNTRRIFHSL